VKKNCADNFPRALAKPKFKFEEEERMWGEASKKKYQFWLREKKKGAKKKERGAKT